MNYELKRRITIISRLKGVILFDGGAVSELKANQSLSLEASAEEEHTLQFSWATGRQYYSDPVNIARGTEDISFEIKMDGGVLNVHPVIKQLSGNSYVNVIEKTNVPAQKKKGCYVATAVYGSYDCPEVWTLRRFRDCSLALTWYGRLFIALYYAVSPTIVKWFGHTQWFNKMWKSKLDHIVQKLQSEGFENTPYNDKDWK